MRVGTSFAAMVAGGLAAALCTKVNEDGTVDAIAFPHGQSSGVLLTAVTPADVPGVEAGSADKGDGNLDEFKDN